MHLGATPFPWEHLLTPRGCRTGWPGPFTTGQELGDKGVCPGKKEGEANSFQLALVSPPFASLVLCKAIFGFLGGGDGRKETLCTAACWGQLLPWCPSPSHRPSGRMGGIFKCSAPLQSPTPYISPLCFYSICRPHPLACLFIQSWENVEINKALIR